MTEIILIRHGETFWNKERRMQGHIDVNLNETGNLQSIALAEKLKLENIKAIYSSDLKRASDTALKISKTLNLPIHLKKGLRERCFGIFEGLRYEEIVNYFPDEFKKWKSRDPDAIIPSGRKKSETLIDFYNRALKNVKDIANNHSNEKIVIVTHGGVLDCVYRMANKIILDAKRDFPILNAAINRLNWDGEKFSVKAWAEFSHLKVNFIDEVDKNHPVY